MIEAGQLLQQRYRIDKQIGQGGMGAVYVATDERFGSTVAIKETLFMDSNFRKAIEREARLLNSLKHTALPRVSDHFEEVNSQFLVMEYIPGEDLGHILEEQQKPFEVEQVVSWADQLLDALDFLHTQEIPVVHRDIKPQNLKLTPRGQIVLLDFGLAKGNPTDAGHQTAAKSIFGYSRNYASLEQIQGTGTDPRSDLYSLAATLYHLLTGIPPEDALTRAMSVLSQKADPLEPASAVRSDIPRGVAGVLQKALDLNASERPASAAEMRQMLRESDKYAYLADSGAAVARPTEAHVLGQKTKIMPEGTMADGVKQTEMKTEVLPSNVSEVTSVRQFAATAGANVTTSSPQAVPAAPAEKKRRPFAIAAGLLGLLLFGGAIAGGIYKYGSGGAGIPTVDKLDKPAAETQSTANASATAANSTAENPTESASGTNMDTTAANVEKSKQSPEKSAETTKNKTGKADNTRGQNDGVNIEVPADEDIPGDMVITRRNPDGSTTTTRITKPRYPNGRETMNDPMNPFPPGVDPNTMTPAQRRKLREALRKNGVQMYPQTPPKPQPQP